jgi:hypothetical protein
MLLYLPLVGVLSCEGGVTSSPFVLRSVFRMLTINPFEIWTFLSISFGAKEIFCGAILK